jgi:hypothetical protein
VTNTPQRFTLFQRVVLAIAPRLVKALLTLDGLTFRYVTVCAEGEAPYTIPQKGLLCFWHQCTLPSTHYPLFRAYKPTILVSQSFDGELIARTLESFGFLTVRGSSSRGGLKGLIGLKKVVERGGKAVFTADGPRGPVYESKMGPVKLSELTGQPIASFHLLPERTWVVNSWDHFLIPKPFTRIVVSWGHHTQVPHGASDELMEEKRRELTANLEGARHQAETWLRENPR